MGQFRRPLRPMPFVPPNRFRQRPLWPAGIRADAAISGQVVYVHGEQNGAIYQKITLGRSDIAAVSLLAEHRADRAEVPHQRQAL